MKTIATLPLPALLALLLGACAGMDRTPPPADLRQAIAGAYGVEAFGRVELIRFETNVEEAGTLVRRRWIWEPRADRVVYQGIGSQLNPTAYHRGKLDADPSGRLARIDRWFAADVRWLLFPLHLTWEGEAAVEAAGRDFLPVGWGRALKVVVTYPPRGGSAPGDVYELFVDRGYRLVAWACRPGGNEGEARASTWEDHRAVGPLTVAMVRNGKDGGFRLWFSDVAVRLEASEEWIAAGTAN